MADAAAERPVTIQPVCLISQQGTGPDSALVIHDEGLDVLRGLGQTPVATVSVAGMYRTGKSFFLNQLMGQSGNGGAGFVVGNTTTSCTRGIWLWLAPPGVWDAPASKSGAQLLVLDTEGLASFDQDETYDAKIFSLGILLASFFVYNSMGVIDESAIDRLFLVGELTKNISLSTVKSKREEEAEPAAEGEETARHEEVTEADLAQFFPPFLWVLRDFSLKLKDGEGNDISLHQYLETALEDRKGSGRRVDDGNRIRQSFRTLFNHRECFTLVRPVHEEEQLQKLATLPQSELRPEFLEGMATAREKILGHVTPKTVFGEVVTGSGLAMLATAYVEAINTGAVPDIRKSWDYVVEETLRLAFEAATSSFKAGLGGYCKSVMAEDAVLPNRDAYAAKVAEETLRSDTVFVEKGGQMAKPQLPGPWIKKLVEERTALRERGLSTLESTSQQRCTTLAQQVLEAQLRQPVSEGTFDNEDITVFEDAVRSALSKYESEAAGPAKAEVAAQALTGKPLLDVFGALQRRWKQQAEAKLAASESALRAEQEAKRGLEAVLESRNELVSQLEAAKAETEAELARTRESLANIETVLGTTREELHTVQRAKDVLESELGESRRLHQEEVARGQAAKQEAENRLAEERQSAAEKAASAKEAHDAVVKGRDEQILTLASSIEREQALAQEASSRHDAQIASLNGEKEGLQAKIASVEEARDADRKAATAAAEQAAEKAAGLAASISEQKAQLDIAAAQKAAVESELANQQQAASTAAASAEATAADLRTHLEQSQAKCAEIGEARTTLEKQHSEVVRGLEDQIAELKRQIEDAAREAERQAELHQLALANSKGQQALATQEAAEQAAEQEEKIAALTASNEEAATEITALGKDVEARLQQVADAQKEIQTLEAEVARVEAELKTTLEKNVRQAL